MDRSQRSVFVGNIAYETTEAELKEMFGKVGPVVHFRLVYDRDTGKPKGYGFCEYADAETAASAIRNLGGIELHGRQLRVDSAAGSDRNQEEVRQLQMTIGAAQEESPYGPTLAPTKAPEAISRAVASLPPEQMFELMKQMKLCIQNNPNEARNMLLQNPQLAYALLQAQVVMRIVEPQMAINMLHKPDQPSAPILPSDATPAAALPPSTLAPGRAQGGLLPVPPQSAAPAAPAPSQLGSSLQPGDVDLRSVYASTLPQPIAAQPTPHQPTPHQPAPQPGVVDDEKAELIVKVLQLTDEQINLLPPDQKTSVLMLRDQLRNAQH